MQGLEDHCFRFTSDELFTGIPAQLVDEWSAWGIKFAVGCHFSSSALKFLQLIKLSRTGATPNRATISTEEKLTLYKLLSKARSLEASEIQTRDIEDSLETSESAKFVKKRTTQKCHQCGYAWPRQNKPCPAIGQTCRKCGNTCQFAKVCKSCTNSAHENRRQQTTQSKPTRPRQGQKPQIRQVQQDTTSQNTPESQDFNKTTLFSHATIKPTTRCLMLR